MSTGLPPLRGSRRLRALPSWPLAGSLGLAVVAIVAVLASAGPAEEQPAMPDLTSAATVAPTDDLDTPDVRPVDDDADEVETAALPIVAFELVLPRDPFEPVRPEPVEDDTSDGDGTANGGSGGDGDGTDQPDDGGGTPPPPSEPGPTLSVQEVFTTSAGEVRARISLGDTAYTVAEGDVFEVGYTVTSISGECVTVDAPGGSVTACVGESVATPTQPVQGCHGVEQLVCEGQVVTLVEITTSAGEPAAVIQVGEDRYVVTVGERFASRYELLSIGDGQVRLVFGDEVYTLLTGGGILK